MAKSNDKWSFRRSNKRNENLDEIRYNPSVSKYIHRTNSLKQNEKEKIQNQDKSKANINQKCAETHIFYAILFFSQTHIGQEWCKALPLSAFSELVSMCTAPTQSKQKDANEAVTCLCDTRAHGARRWNT